MDKVDCENGVKFLNEEEQVVVRKELEKIDSHELKKKIKIYDEAGMLGCANIARDVLLNMVFEDVSDLLNVHSESFMILSARLSAIEDILLARCQSQPSLPSSLLLSEMSFLNS